MMSNRVWVKKKKNHVSSLKKILSINESKSQRKSQKIVTNKSKIETTIIRERLARATTMIVKTSFATIVKNRDTWKHIALILRRRILKLMRSRSLKRLSRHVVFATISTMRKIKRARVNHYCNRESIRNRSQKKYQNNSRENLYSWRREITSSNDIFWRDRSNKLHLWTNDKDVAFK